MSSKSTKAVIKTTKSIPADAEFSIPIWLLEESSSKSEAMSAAADPWLSGEAAVAEVTAVLPDKKREIGTTSKHASSSAHPKSNSQKRPRALSSSEQVHEPTEVIVPEENVSSDSRGDEVRTADNVTAAQPTPADISSSPSDSGEDVIIDDCTFSDDDCVVLDNPASATTAKPSPPATPSSKPAPSTPRTPSHHSTRSAQADPAPFGLSEVIPVDSDTVLVTTAPRFCLLLWGACQVRVLRGALSVHGALLTPARTEFLPVFALRVKALPPLTSVDNLPGGGEDIRPAELSALPEEAAAAVRRSSGCALLLRRLPSRLLTLLTARHGDTFTPRGGGGEDVVMARTGCRLLREAGELQRLGLSPHRISQEWEEWLKRLTKRGADGERLRVVFAGGKGVGKSTWLYYVLNRLLATWRHVYVLDVDPGQAEFTPCACLSLLRVDTFTVGPAFTHITKPVRSVFTGEISVANDPFGYMDGVQQLVDTYRGLAESDPAPLLVNTMGWAKGLGEDLLLEVLGLTQPTDLLEIVHPSKEDVNFARPLTARRVNSAGWSWLLRRYLPPGAPGRPAVSHRHCRLVSGARAEKGGRNSTLAPWMYRQLNTTAFAASLEQDGRTLCQLTPVCVPWNCLAVHVSTGPVLPQHVMHAINGTVVALCRTDPDSWQTPPDPSLFALLPRTHRRPECLGFGLVRGVDADQRALYLLTDLSAADLICSVNTVLRGPHHLLDVFPADSGLRSWTPALTEDHRPPPRPLDRPNRRHKVARTGTAYSRSPRRVMC